MTYGKREGRIAGISARRHTGTSSRPDAREASLSSCLAGDLFILAVEGGPHLVMIDGRDDVNEFQEVYPSGFQHGWPRLPYHPVAPLREHGFSAFLGGCSNGPVNEIAELLTSCVIRSANREPHRQGAATQSHLDRWAREIG